MTVSVNTHIRACFARFTLPTHAVCRRDGTHSSFLKLGIAAVLLLLAVLCMAAPAAAAGGTTGNLTWDLTDGTLTISGEGAMPDYGGYSNQPPWYPYCGSITSLVIEEGVTSIGDNAFKMCSSLSSVGISSGVMSIGEDAFESCINLTSIDIPSGVTCIGENAFADCIGLTCVTFAEGSLLTDIGFGVFTRCSCLASIVIPSNVTNIGYGVFSWCSNLSSIDVEEGNQNYQDIDGVLFSKDGTVLYNYPGGKSAVSYEIPSGVTEISFGVFAGCSHLSYIEIPSGVTEIGYGAFSDCSGLISIEIPSGVTEVGTGAFYNCSSLTSIVFAEGSQLTSIGLVAFDSCSSLTSITFAEGSQLMSIGENAFNECYSLSSIELPSSVTEIGESAFSCCFNLTSIEIPSNVTKIGESTFSECISLTSVVIPSGVTEIGERAFSDCSSLISIEIPSNVTEIGERAFSGCSSLISIEIPSNVTEIGERAFSGCSNLTSIEIPSNVTEIGESAFSGCSNLTSVVIRSGATDIGSDAFHSLAENSIIYCTDASRLSDTYSTGKTALAVNNSNGSYTFSSSVTNLVLSKENAPAGIIYGGWFAESSFTTPVTGIASGENPTLWLNIRSGYSVTVISTEGGTASASKTSSAAGNLITLTASANNGYIFKEWQVLSGGVTIVNNQFIMPACDVEIQAVFEDGEPSDAMYLSSGWNFVSVPKKLAAAYDTAAELFGSVNTSGNAVLFYNAETKLWEQVTGETVIEPLNAYWIYSVEKNTISPEFDKGASVPAVKKVYEGWNAVGLSAEEPMTAAAVFNNIGWRTYLSWNAAEQKYYTAIIKGGSGKYSDENKVYLWKGGWVYMDSDATFIGYA